MKDWLKRGISLVLIASMATSCLQPYVFAAELAQSSAEIVAEAAADAEESLTEVEEEAESEDENAEETEEEAEEADEAEEAPEEDTADEAIEADEPETEEIVPEEAVTETVDALLRNAGGSTNVLNLTLDGAANSGKGWEVRDGKLYLTNFEQDVSNDNPADAVYALVLPNNVTEIVLKGDNKITFRDVAINASVVEHLTITTDPDDEQDATLTLIDAETSFFSDNNKAQCAMIIKDKLTIEGRANVKILTSGQGKCISSFAQDSGDALLTLRDKAVLEMVCDYEGSGHPYVSVKGLSTGNDQKGVFDAFWSDASGSWKHNTKRIKMNGGFIAADYGSSLDTSFTRGGANSITYYKDATSDLNSKSNLRLMAVRLPASTVYDKLERKVVINDAFYNLNEGETLNNGTYVGMNDSEYSASKSAYDAYTTGKIVYTKEGESAHWYVPQMRTNQGDNADPNQVLSANRYTAPYEAGTYQVKYLEKLSGGTAAVDIGSFTIYKRPVAVKGIGIDDKYFDNTDVAALDLTKVVFTPISGQNDSGLILSSVNGTDIVFEGDDVALLPEGVKVAYTATEDGSAAFNYAVCGSDTYNADYPSGMTRAAKSAQYVNINKQLFVAPDANCRFESNQWEGTAAENGGEKPEDVAYVNNIRTNGSVTSKPVSITDITLNNQNYEVVAGASQKDAEAVIWPRNLNNAAYPHDAFEGATTDSEKGVNAHLRVMGTERSSAADWSGDVKTVYPVIRLSVPAARVDDDSYVGELLTQYVPNGDEDHTSGVFNEEAVAYAYDYTISGQTSKLEPGTYSVRITGRGNYTGSINLSWSVDKVARKVIVDAPSVAYTNTAYADPVEAAQADPAKAVFRSEVFHETNADKPSKTDITGEFVKKALDQQEITAKTQWTVAYEKWDDTLAVPAYVALSGAPTEIGKYRVTVTVEETAHYQKGIGQAEFTIGLYELHEADFTWEDTDLTYNGQAQKPTPTVVPQGDDKVSVKTVKYVGLDAAGVPYAESETAPTNAGQYSAIIYEVQGEDAGNYTLDVNDLPRYSFEIKQKEVSLTWYSSENVEWADTFAYTFNNKRQGPTAKAGLLVGSDKCDVSINYSGDDVYTDPHSEELYGLVNVSGAEGYTAEAYELSNKNYKLHDTKQENQLKYEIKPLDLTTLSKKTQSGDKTVYELAAQHTTYTGNQFMPVIAWEKDGCSETMDKFISVAAPDSKNRKYADYTAFGETIASEPCSEDYAITITGVSNYTGTVDVLWNIEKIVDDVRIVDFPSAIVYGGTLPDADYGYVGFVHDTDKFTVTLKNTELLNSRIADTNTWLSIYGVTYGEDAFNGGKYEDGELVAGGTLNEMTLRDFINKASGWHSILPTQAGEYVLRVRVAGTDHYVESIVEQRFTIQKLPLVVSGLTVNDKYYDGNTTAVLSADNVVLDGILPDDEGLVSIQGTAAFADKHVMMSNGEVISKTVNLGKDLELIPADENAGKVYTNYEVSSRSQQTTAKAKILPAELYVSGGVKANDKVYDGSNVAQLDYTNVTFTFVNGGQTTENGAVIPAGDKLTVTAEGIFDTVGKLKGKSVKWVDEQPQPAGKRVTIQSYVLKTANQSTRLNDYLLVEHDNSNNPYPVQYSYEGAIISPKEVHTSATVNYPDNLRQWMASSKPDEPNGSKLIDLKWTPLSSNMKCVDSTNNQLDQVYVDNVKGEVEIPTEYHEPLMQNVTFTAQLIGDDAPNYKLVDDSQPLTAGILPLDSAFSTDFKRYELVYGLNEAYPLDCTVEHGSLTFTSDNQKVVKVDEQGKMTPVGVGSAKITVSFERDAHHAKQDPCTIDVYVQPRDISAGECAVQNDTLVYNGKNQTFKVESVTVNDQVTITKFPVNSAAAPVTEDVAADCTLEASDYDVTGNVKKNHGEYALTVTGKGNYTGSVNTDYQILRRSVSVKLDNLSKVYSTKDPKLTYTAVGELANELLDLRITREKGEDAGTYAITAVETETNPNYTVTITDGEFTIKPADIAKGTATLAYEKAWYNRKERKPAASVEVLGRKLTKEDFTTAYSSNIEVGKATVKLTGQGNYCGTIKKTFTIAEPVTSNTNLLNAGLNAAMSGTTATVNWGTVSNADGYDVFFAQCGKSFGKAALTTKDNTTLRYVKKNLNRKATYKTYVKAFRMVNGKKVYIAASYTLHFTGDKNAKTNAASVKVDSANVLIQKGKTSKTKITLKRQNQKKKLLGHVKQPICWSDKTSVATVSATGVITAKAKGSCKVYIMAENGVKRQINVTVK